MDRDDVAGRRTAPADVVLRDGSTRRGRLVDGLRTRPLLSGYRGSPPRDVEALVDAVLRVGALVDDLAQVRELDLNPILVHEQGATIVDARIRVAPADPEPLPGARQ